VPLGETAIETLKIIINGYKENCLFHSGVFLRHINFLADVNESNINVLVASCPHNIKLTCNPAQI
jgi:hypothetical protein